MSLVDVRAETRRAFLEKAAMSHILAIESDRKRQTLLMALIREHVLAEVTMVDSVKQAIASFERHQPDLIVAPALLSPEDSERLNAHVKWHADPHVQMLTLPALDMLREPAAEEQSRSSLFAWRRPLTLGLQYDPSIVARQIADGLDRALALREHRARDMRPLLRKPEAMVVGQPIEEATSRPPINNSARRNRAERLAQRHPWMWGVRMPWGTEVDMVNISHTGLLLESGSKVAPGVTLELQLTGMGQSRIVLARFVRSEIARVDRLGVRYHAAAQFDQPFDLLVPRTEPTPTATPRSLAELFSTVICDSGQPEDASIRFARGLRGLIGARDVSIRPTPIAPSHDCESIYFRVNGDDRSGMILQVLFDRDRALTAAEFRLMKAATGLASALLELQQSPTDNGRVLPASLAQVA
jgi:CheY-like chemotaxis protein